MARRMIDPQVIIKSQIVNDKYSVDLNEILEKYGTQNEYGYKSVTLQFYSKEVADDSNIQIQTDTDYPGYIIPNGAITISKYVGIGDDVYISGSIIDSLSTMNLKKFIEILAGDYENGIIVYSPYQFDVHVIKV